MGISKDQMMASFGISKGYHDKEVADLESRVNALIQTLYDTAMGEETNKIHPLTNNQAGLEDTPVGHILAYMGTTAPKHYLICDGSTYNIADYPALSTHILNEFGTVNYFGGDGETTFAVPDLRNEFLRGYHGDAAKKLSGEIGKHQNGTIHVGQIVYGKSLVTMLENSTSATSNVTQAGTYYDEMLCNRKGSLTIAEGTNVRVDSYSDNHPASFTSKPTNVAVLYCIKCDHTYYLQTGAYGDYFDEEERIVGTFKRKTLYRKSYQKQITVTIGDNSLPIPENCSEVIDVHGYTTAVNVTVNGSMVNIPCAVPGYICDLYHSIIKNIIMFYVAAPGTNYIGDRTITYHVLYTKD